MEHKLPENKTIKDYICFPFLSFKSYLYRLKTIFSIKFLVALIIINLFLNGLLYQSVKWIILPIFKSQKMDAVTVQMFTAVIFSPFAIKPLFGILSDLIPIKGYTKKWWMILFISIGMLSGVCLILFPISVNLILFCLIGLSFETSIVDLLSEGAYTKIIKENPSSGSDVITFVKGLKNIGQIIALSFLGPLIDGKLYLALFIIITCICIIPVIPVLLNYIPEEKHGNKLITFNTSLFKSNWKSVIVIAFTGISALILALLSIYINKIIVMVVSLVLLGIIVAGSYISFPRMIAHVILYQIIINITKPSLGSAMDYFYTANPKTCLIGGPGFDFKYYITYTGLLGTAFKFITVWIYQVFLSKLRFRTVLIITTILRSLAGLSDMIIVLRWNIKLGISDSAFYILGEAIIEKVIQMLYYIPLSTLISKICATNMESSTYAFLSGIGELSVMVSRIIGSVIIEYGGIKTIVPCDFSKLWWLILVCHIIPPLIIGIPMTWLIPNVTQKESIDQVDQVGNVFNELEEVEKNEDFDIENFNPELNLSNDNLIMDEIL